MRSHLLMALWVKNKSYISNEIVAKNCGFIFYFYFFYCTIDILEMLLIFKPDQTTKHIYKSWNSCFRQKRKKGETQGMVSRPTKSFNNPDSLTWCKNRTKRTESLFPSSPLQNACLVVAGLIFPSPYSDPYINYEVMLWLYIVGSWPIQPLRKFCSTEALLFSRVWGIYSWVSVKKKPCRT